MPQNSTRRLRALAPLVAVAAIVATPQSVGAATATTSFQVTLNVISECIVAAAPLDFGTRAVVGAAVSATSQITVTCTAQTPFTIGLGNGTGPGATPENRVLQGPNGSTVGYALFQDAGFAAVWGNTPGTVVNGGAATGQAQNFPVYGRIPAGQTAAAPGAYTDTIAVTVTY